MIFLVEFQRLRRYADAPTREGLVLPSVDSEVDRSRLLHADGRGSFGAQR
jgi:hypothetical protein